MDIARAGKSRCVSVSSQCDNLQSNYCGGRSEKADSEAQLKRMSNNKKEIKMGIKWLRVPLGHMCSLHCSFTKYWTKDMYEGHDNIRLMYNNWP